MNKIIMIGNLTKDPEFSTTANGTNVCKFDIAINERYGEKDAVQYFHIVTWRGLAENCSKYLVKGNKVCVMGRLEVREYESKEGVKKTAVEVIADEVEFLSPKSSSDTE